VTTNATPAPAIDETAVKLDEQARPLRLVLRGTVDSYFADELYFVGLRILDSGSGVDVDCAAVEHLGAAAVQILFALRRELGARGLDLRLVALPPPIATLVTWSGLLPASAGEG